MCLPDPLDQIREHSRIARNAIAEAQAIIADCIAAIEGSLRVIGSDSVARHDKHAGPPFPPSP
jgi:hypothetical protein